MGPSLFGPSTFNPQPSHSLLFLRRQGILDHRREDPKLLQPLEELARGAVDQQGALVDARVVRVVEEAQRVGDADERLEQELLEADGGQLDHARAGGHVGQVAQVGQRPEDVVHRLEGGEPSCASAWVTESKTSTFIMLSSVRRIAPRSVRWMRLSLNSCRSVPRKCAWPEAIRSRSSMRRSWRLRRASLMMPIISSRSS